MKKMKPQAHGVDAQVAADTARLRRLEAFHGLELLTAHYSRHAFPRHLHNTFVVQVVEQGVDEFLCQGATYLAPAGSVVIINPHNVHTGRSADAAPLRYRSLYPAVELLCEI